MGVDIHTYIVKNKEVIGKNLYNGRNSEWFNNLQGRGDDLEYNRLYTDWGISPQAPDYFNDKYTQEKGYYGFYYISVKEFKEWYVLSSCTTWRSKRPWCAWNPFYITWRERSGSSSWTTPLRTAP